MRIDFSCSKSEEGSYDKVRKVTKQESLMDQDREINREELHDLVYVETNEDSCERIRSMGLPRHLTPNNFVEYFFQSTRVLS